MVVRGGAQVVGHGPQEVGAHFLPLGVGLELFGVLDLGGQGAGNDGHHQHDHSREKVYGNGEIELKIGKRKDKIDRQHADQRGGDAPAVAGGDDGNEKNAQHEDHGAHGVGLEHRLGQEAEQKGNHQDPGGHEEIFGLLLHGHPLHLTKSVYHTGNKDSVKIPYVSYHTCQRFGTGNNCYGQLGLDLI